jgi:hypothetical protein
VSGVEEEETHQATASAAIVSRVKEEGSRQGTTSDDIIASHISGVEEAVGEIDASMQYSSSFIDVVLTGGKWIHSHVTSCGTLCTYKCVRIQENGSGPYLNYKSPVTSLKELEEAVEECNAIKFSVAPPHICYYDGDMESMEDIEFFEPHPMDMRAPELEVTEEFIKLLMRINKYSVSFSLGCASTFLEHVFSWSWYNNVPNLLKLAVGMVVSSVVCPMSPFVDKARMDSAFMSSHTMPQLLKLLLEFNPNFYQNSFRFFLPDTLSDAATRSWVMMQEYNPIFFWYIKGFKEAGLLSLLGVPKDEFHCYSQTTNSECTLQNLTNQWKLDAHVNGLKSPWSTIFNQKLQKIKLEVLMEPSVLLNNSLSLKILNLKFHNHNAGSNAGARILSQFFLSGVALTATPEVDVQHFMFTKLGLGSANPAHDKLFGTTLGTSATVPLGKGVPTLGFTSTQTISLTSKSVRDWKHEQTHGTQNCHSSKSGTFSWTLKNLGGIPFHRDNPSYPRSSKKSRLELPFNEDGSVTSQIKSTQTQSHGISNLSRKGRWWFGAFQWRCM